jgi:hypothetical protein
MSFETVSGGANQEDEVWESQRAFVQDVCFCEGHLVLLTYICIKS